MSHPPLHLTARDFDAYAPEKATSNAYSRPRLEVKQRALAWARAVVTRLGELGIAVDVHGSDEHPSLRNRKRVDCQWVFFSRDQAARDELDRLQGRGRSIAAELDDPSPFMHHAFLALRLEAGAVEVCFAVHPQAQVDMENLRARLAVIDGVDGVADAAAELTSALRALPEQFAIGVTAEDRVPASVVTPEALRAFVEQAAAGQVPLWIGWSVSRDTAIEHAAILDEQLEDALIALAPIYRLVAWSRDNDRLALDRRLESAEQDRARAHAEAEAENERWRTEQAAARRSAAEQARARAVLNLENARERSAPILENARERPAPILENARERSPTVNLEGARERAPTASGRGAPARRPSLDTLFAGKKKPAGAPAAPPGVRAALDAGRTPPPPAPSVPAAAPEGARERPPPIEAEGERTTPTSVGPPPLEKGVKVRVLSGPFAEKVGVIGELDGRGSARVLLGLLSTRLDLTDLEPVVEGRERPALQSSHRRPLAPAPRKAR